VVLGLVSVGPANGRQHRPCHPAAEGFGLRLSRREDQLVEAALTDDGHFLLASKGICISDPLLILVKIKNLLAGVGECQDRTNVGGDEPRLSCMKNASHSAALEAELYRRAAG